MVWVRLAASYLNLSPTPTKLNAARVRDERTLNISPVIPVEQYNSVPLSNPRRLRTSPRGVEGLSVPPPAHFGEVSEG